MNVSLLKTQCVLVILLYFSSFQTQAQVYYKYYKGKKEAYTISPRKIITRFKDQVLKEKRSLALSVNPNIKSISSISEGHHFSQIELKKDSIGHVKKLLDNLKNDTSVLFISPMLLNERNEEIGAYTDQFIVKLKTKPDLAKLKDIANRYKIQKITRYEFDDLTYYLSVPGSSEKNSMELAALFYETRLFEWAEPDLLILVKRSTNDTFYNQQWALNNTGQSGGTVGADMKVPQAWNYTTGCSNIKVALLDEGVELNHPDLQANLLPGFDATGGNSAGANTNNDPHGVACAGIIGAVGNNGIGIAGVAYNCRIISVRTFIGTSNADDITTAGWEAAAIDLAWQNNADILSCSWISSVGQQNIGDAVTRAVTQGRNGLGCIVLAASGNQSSSTIAFPASLPNVISVGSTNNHDSRSSFSNYGTGIDLVAPGENVYTTDLQGTSGFNTSSGTDGNYSSTFTGTSAATPNAAGVMALILSINPTLTQAQATQILESSCDKITGYTYSSNVAGQPNGTWNNEVGYGRVNAYKAVLAAGNIIASSLPVCSTSNFSIQSQNTLSLTWASGNPNALSINATTGVATRMNNYQGNVSISATINGSCGPLAVSPVNVWVGPPVLGLALDGHALPSDNFLQVTTGQHTLSIFNYGSGNISMDVARVIGGNFPGTTTHFPNMGNGEEIDYGWAIIHTGETYTFAISSSSACGNQSTGAEITTDSNISDVIIAYPNPVASTMTVQVNDSPSANSTTLSHPYQINIMNRYSQTVYTIQSNERILQIPIDDLPQDIYYLHITYKNAVQQKQIVIKR